jgi:hypothetical protein
MSDSRRVIIAPKSTFRATVQKIGGRITAVDPITVKNQIREIRSVEDIPGVNAALRTDGAVLIFNANTQEYDIRLLTTVNVATAYITSLYANGSPGQVGQTLLSNGSAIYWGGATGIREFTYAAGNNTFRILTSSNETYTASINSVNNFTVTGNLDFVAIDGGNF